MATPPSLANGDGDDMIASLWSELQCFIDLSMIFAKLPLASFFRLRQVCKEWNYLASDRQFLEQNFKPPISSNPYFVFPRLSRGHVLLTFEGLSWSSTPLPRTQCEVSGLLFDDSKFNRVFDLHTRVFHTLPPLFAMVQKKRGDFEDPLIGMTVDTTLVPYRFKVILADNFKSTGTKIYNSNSNAWTHNPSTHTYNSLKLPSRTSCVQYNKSLYIRIADACNSRNNVQTYDLERDEWSCQERWRLWNLMKVIIYSDIVVWQDRWFVFAVDISSHFKVWETLSNFEEPWSLFDRMPIDLYKWMTKGLEYPNILSKFCGEHVLVYNHVEDEERAILYNLDRKTWDKIELPEY